MSRENNCRPGFLGRGCEQVAACAFDRNFFCLKTSAAELAMQEIAHRPLVAGDRLDVDELTGKSCEVKIHG